MGAFGIGEIVLISNGHGGYIPRKIQAVREDGCEIVCGYYATFYNSKDIHKCPKSISKAKLGEEGE